MEERIEELLEEDRTASVRAIPREVEISKDRVHAVFRATGKH